jgi:transketolase C-terminal domain/subunit
MHTIKCLDKEIINSLINRRISIIALEKHSIFRGLGSTIAEVIATSNAKVKLIEYAIPDIYSHYVSSAKEIARHYDIFSKS